MPDISNLVIKIDSNGVVQATGNFGKFVEASERARKSATGLEKSAASLGNNFAAFNLIAGRLPGPLKDIASGMMGLVSPGTAAVGAVISLTEAAVNFAKGSLEAFGEYEMIKTNLELVMGSAEAAAGTFADLRELAAKTPFDLPGVTQAASMLRQAGVAAGDLVSTIETLGNVSGGNMERFNRIAYNYTQVLQKGIMDARDTREFAGNLVPINKILQEMGVTGQVAADDMVEAFRRMTAEGGMFFNAINRQGDTLIGKTEQLKEAWTEFQATWAETSGLGGLWKNILDAVTVSLNEQTEAMNENIRIRELADRLNSGDKSIGTQYELAAASLKKLTRELDKISGYTDSEGYFSLQILELQKEIDANNAIISQYQEQIDMLEKRTAAEQSWKDAIGQSGQDYLTLQSQIQEAYAKTEKGQEEALLAEIAVWEERLKATRIVEKEMPWSNGLKIAQTIGLSEIEINNINAILKMLNEDLDKVGKKAKDLKTELSDWQQLLMSTLGISDQAALTGITALEEYTTGFYDRLGGALSYAQIAGEDAAEVYGEFADEIERARKALMYSGKFEVDDASIRGLSALFDKISAFSKSQTKPIWQDILKSATGFSDEEINTWKDRETIIDRYITKMQSAQFDAKFLNEKGLVDYADSLSGIANEWEEIYKTMISASVWKDGSLIQVFDPTLDENAKILEKVFAMMKEARQNAGNANFDKYIADLEKAAKIPFMSANERKLADTEEKLKAAGIQNPSLGQIDQAIDAQDKAVTNEYEKQLDIQKRLLSGKMSMKQFAIEQLQIEYGISEEAAKQVYEYQKQAETLQSLRDILRQLGETSLSGLIDMAHELGAAFKDGTVSSNEFSDALGNMVKRIIDALPQLLLSAGLQMMATNWKLGLAFIAASGLASFVSGMVSDSGKDGAEDQVARLQRIQDEISKLIDQQKSLEEYYFKKRQEMNARAAMGVNDLIVTPQGSFSTHPDDYIIATKRPETLGSGGGVQMNVKIVNNAGAVITTRQGIGADGINDLLVAVDQRIQNNIASGRYDSSLATRDARIRGRDIRTS